MSTPELRRHNLRSWISRLHDGRQNRFAAETGINQGELSALLKNKTFGERKARKVEQSAGMPLLWLDTDHGDFHAATSSATSFQASHSMTQFATIPEILADIKAGKMVIITDAIF